MLRIHMLKNIYDLSDMGVLVANNIRGAIGWNWPWHMNNYITFLGDTALLSENFASDYTIDTPYIFNLEYVISNALSAPAGGKVLLSAPFHDFNRKRPAKRYMVEI